MQRLCSILGVATAPLEARHQTSGLNTRFNGGQLAFADYVAQTRYMIGKVRAGASADDLEKIPEKIAPRAARAKWHKIVRWLMPAKQWVHIIPDTDIYKYESLPKNAAAQMYALTQEVSSQLQKHELNIPVFAAASQDDTTASTSATVEFMARAHHPSSKLVLYTTDMENLPSGISAGKLDMVNSALPGQKILSSAHTAIVLPADDAHYGMAGDYANCIHYFPSDREKYAACKQRAKDIWQGEITDKNLKTGILCRLMVNPNFAALKISMQRFIASLSQAEQSKHESL